MHGADCSLGLFLCLLGDIQSSALSTFSHDLHTISTHFSLPEQGRVNSKLVRHQCGGLVRRLFGGLFWVIYWPQTHTDPHRLFSPQRHRDHRVFLESSTSLSPVFTYTPNALVPKAFGVEPKTHPRHNDGGQAFDLLMTGSSGGFPLSNLPLTSRTDRTV